jgi:HEAT repeat protein
MMTARFKTGLLLAAALAVGVVIAVLLPERGAGAGARDLLADDPGGGVGPRGGGGSIEIDRSGETPDPEEGGLDGMGEPARGPGIEPGLRTPSGIDLSNPDTRLTELHRLLGGEVINWQKVGELLAIMTEPVPAELRGVLLDELRAGNRHQVMHAFRVLRDPSFVEDLFDVLDDPNAGRGAQAAALQALWQMPGAGNDDVALRLEGRLSNDPGKDRALLHALAARGGVEATRALVQYLTRSPQPGAVQQFILHTLDFSDNPQAAAVLDEALNRPQEPAVLAALVDMAGRPGGERFTRSLIDLDNDAQKPELRAKLYQALGKIGDESAVDYLLGKSEEAGAFGEKAIHAIRGIHAADLGARSKLTKALEMAALNPRPEKMKESLLLSLGALRHRPAMLTIAEHLADPSPGVRHAAIDALGRMGSPAAAHTEAIATRYGGTEQTKIKVAVALATIGGTEALTYLERWEADEDNSPSLQRTLKMGVRAIQARTGSK